MIKSIADMPSIIYHGTSSNFHDSLISRIQLNQNHSPTDFGNGFYTTTIYEQSRDFAIKKSALRQNKYPECQPMIVALHLDTNILTACHGKIFNTPDRQWKEFIFNNRLGRNFIISSLHNLDISFDYVFGAVADSDIVQMCRMTRNHKLSPDDFINQIQALHNGDADQLSFHSPSALASITIDHIEILPKEESLIC